MACTEGFVVCSCWRFLQSALVQAVGFLRMLTPIALCSLYAPAGSYDCASRCSGAVSALYGWYKSLCCASDDCLTLLLYSCAGCARSAWLQSFGLTVWLHWFRFNYMGSQQFWDLTANVCLLVVYIGGKLALFLPPRLHSSLCSSGLFVLSVT